MRNLLLVSALGIAVLAAGACIRDLEAETSAAGKKLQAPAAKNEAVGDLVTSFSQDLKDLQAKQSELSARLDALDLRQREYEIRSAEIFKRILERIASVEADGSTLNGASAGKSEKKGP